MTHPPAPSRRNADVAPTPPAIRPTAFHTNAIGIGEIGVARSEGVLRTFVGSWAGAGCGFVAGWLFGFGAAFFALAFAGAGAGTAS